MNITKTDPRVIRTRHLIIDSFVKLSTQKEFKSITIKDITDEATINRATFYYHFSDKYDLLEQTVKSSIMKDVLNRLSQTSDINSQTVVEIFLAITEFLNNLYTQCQTSFSSFQETIEMSIKQELQELFYNILKEKSKESSTDYLDNLRIYSTLLAWSIYGAVLDCQSNSKTTPKKYALKTIPYIFEGMNSLLKSEQK